jgi:glycogen phosphorylase
MSMLSPCSLQPSAHAEDGVSARLASPLQPLAALAYNLWWSWQLGGSELFRAVDAQRWEGSHHNPVKLLRDASASRLASVARDGELLARSQRLAGALDEELRKPWAEDCGATPQAPVAFLCAEYGLHPSLPIYSGGLGVLAGDVLKEASDSGLPMVGVGLFYRRGFFHQRLDRSGWQNESWTESNPEELPMRLEVDAQGNPRLVHVTLRGHAVGAQIWHVQVGRVPLFLLDTNLLQNEPVDRWITSTLYIGDRAFRVMQYAVLAIGGLRALRTLGITPSTVHLNEGHAALASLELARQEVQAGAPFERALAAARERVVFTTHTPVPAGNEHYQPGEILELLGHLPAELGIDAARFLALGRAQPEDASQPFGVSELALRTSRRANAVSARHGDVARRMWQPLWPGVAVENVPITHVTNGVHLPTWMAPEFQDLLRRYLPPGWLEGDGRAWEAVEAIPDTDVWAARLALRTRLVEYVRRKSVADRLIRGEPISYVEGAARTFEPSVLTLGFARRVAAYKRLQLLIRDAGRALALLQGPRRLQLVIAGKAHPSDDNAKRLVQLIFGLKGGEGASTHVAFLEDYDMEVAHQLVAGCDVWLNVPRAPLEASGTSGMKAALNGGLNLSVLDGWWCEGFDGRTGWALPAHQGLEEEAQDAQDADALYGLLEREVVPAFYERGEDGVPHAWVARMKASLRKVGSTFTTRRMLREYVERVYRR